MATIPPIDDLPPTDLHRYLAGEATPVQVEAVEEWMCGGPGRREEVEAMRRGLRESVSSEARMNVEAAVAGVMSASGLTGARVTPPAARASRPYPWTIVAAAILVVAVGSVWWVGSSVTRSAPQPMREFATAPGARATITLRDGTRLVLGPESRIRIPNDFGRPVRAMQLDGEAYFSVVHDVRHPLTVQTGHTTITDVGTEFDVRHYATDGEVRVAVAEGRVSVGTGLRSGRPSPMLSAGDAADVTDTAIVITHGANIAAAMAWTQGGLVFADTPLPQVVRQLERTYGVSITLSDSTLGREVVTASFNSVTLNEVLDVVTHAIGAQYHQTGRAIVIRRRTSAGNPAPAHRSPVLTTVNASAHE